MASTSRRSFLQIGSLALGGLSLPQLLTATEAKRTHTDRSVIFLFLQGGPSQIETFDPKPTAPREYRSVTGEVASNIPGVSFGGTFVRLARYVAQTGRFGGPPPLGGLYVG